MKNIKISLLLCCACLGLAFSLIPDKKINVYLIGDSTVCLYPASRAPLTGWGMPFADYFDQSVSIKNAAKGGRSTRTFLAENLWKPILDSLQKGDYVMIQFGHNDEAKQPQYADRYTPVADYKINLLRLIDETRKKGGVPILITPVSRMNFDKNGNAVETHVEYTAAVFEVGTQRHVPVIDLDRKSRELFQKMGRNATAQLFMTLDSLEHPNYPIGSHDNTHFNEYGARRIAEIVLNDLKGQHIELANRIVKRK